MGVEKQMTPEEKIAHIEAEYNAQIIQLEYQKRRLMTQRNQLIAQIILEESDLSKIDDFDYLYYLSLITVESLSKLLNNADIIKFRYYLKSAIILLEHGNHLDRDRLLEEICTLANTHLYDAEDFVNILKNKIDYKSAADIVNMSKQIIDDAKKTKNK